MLYVKLPENIKFTSPRQTGTQKDAFDILVDGNVVHTFEYYTGDIRGNSSEEFIIAQSHVEAKDWLRKNKYLFAE